MSKRTAKKITIKSGNKYLQKKTFFKKRQANPVHRIQIG